MNKLLPFVRKILKKKHLKYQKATLAKTFSFNLVLLLSRVKRKERNAQKETGENHKNSLYCGNCTKKYVYALF